MSPVRQPHLSSWPVPPSLHIAACVSEPPPLAWQADYCNTHTCTQVNGLANRSEVSLHYS